MKSHVPGLIVLSAALAALVLVAPPSRAGEEEEGEVIEFDEANVFFELNDTDGDLGIHALIDGEPWKTLEIETPNGQTNLLIHVRGRLRAQGLTELFFESAEPTFDELPPDRFFRRFPEGEYEISGVTLEGDELESTATVTHLIPAPVGDLAVNGTLLPDSCDEELPLIGEPFTISWDAVDESHPDLGRTGEPIEVVRYEVVVEREEGEPLSFAIVLPPDVTEVDLPGGLTSEGEEIKVEVLVREESGNQTAVESCFEVD
jgi:hypothetical protein